MGIVIGTILGFAITIETALAVASAMLSVVMVVSAKKQQMPSAARGQAERKQTLRSSTAAVDWVYGRTVKAGVLAFAEEEEGGWQDENPDPEENQGFVEWLHMVHVLCDHPIDRVERIWLNDDLIETYGENVTYEIMNDRTTPSDFLLKNCPSWRADMIGRGLTAIRISMKFSQKKFPSGIPNVKVEVFGRKVYDPRDKKAKWSDNAALVYLDFLRNHPKIKVPDSRVDWELFKTAASICDEIVTRPDGAREKRYTINGAFDLSERPSAIMDDMLLSMYGERTEFGGLHGVMAGAYYGGLPTTVTSDQILGNVEIMPEASRRDRINTINGTFVDPQQLYIETDYPQIQVSEWVQEDGEEIKDDLKLRFVTSDYQAQRLANIQMRRKRLGRTLSFKMNASGYGIRQGMYIQLKIPQMGIDSEMRVIDWSLDPSDMSADITVRQDGIEIWEDAIGKPMDRPPLTNLPSGIPAPSSLQYRTEVVGEVVQGLITWLNTAQVAYTNILIKRSGTLVYTAQEMRTIHRIQGLPVGDYSAELIAVGMNGAQSAISTLAFSIQAPPSVIGCDIRAGNWEISLTPKLATAGGYGTQFEFFYYRTPLPVGEVISKAQNLGTGSQIIHSGLQPDTLHYYWIRAINAYGQGPLFALEAKTTKDVNSVLDVISGQIGAEDLIEELRNPLTETIDMWTAKVGNTDIGKYGGIGLTIEQDPDGVWRTKCIVDAEVFAILDPSGATGENSRHPFIVKDGVVYMNKLLLDDAEIGAVIAKYINVELLEGVTIKGGQAFFGKESGAPFDGYHTRIATDGTLSTDRIRANGGSFENVVIKENCSILGELSASQIVGDITSSITKSNTPVSVSTSGTSWVRSSAFGSVRVVTGRSWNRVLVVSLNVRMEKISGEAFSIGKARLVMVSSLGDSVTSNEQYLTVSSDSDKPISSGTIELSMPVHSLNTPTFTVYVEVARHTTSRTINVSASVGANGNNNRWTALLLSNGYDLG